jgi:hypothetical protein
MSESPTIVPREPIEKCILVLRGQRVILDRDLAALYGLPVRALKQAVRRNIERFPYDFMFVLDKHELAEWRSQFVTSKADRIGLRYAPMAFTEQGVAMLSSVLRSERAVAVNIQIMRAFVRLRQLVAANEDLAHKLALLEKKYDVQFKVVFDAIRALMAGPKKQKKPIGFGVKEKAPVYGFRGKSNRKSPARGLKRSPK